MATRAVKTPESKINNGSLSNKYPVILDGGKTIIYISDKSKEAEVRARYEQRKRNLNEGESS